MTELVTKYQQYAEYKDSGVEWLGEIPSHWDILSGKRVFNSIRKKALSTDQQLAASQKYGVIPQSVMMKLNDAKVMLALKGTDSFRHVRKDNFVISLRSFEGGIEHSNYNGCVSPAYTVLEAIKRISPKFYKYLFKSAPYIAALQSSTDSLRDGKSISYDQFGFILLPIFNIDEQDQIATFLDYETAQTDTLIDKQQTLIQLLKEKRQAVISHAVTKGLNPDAPMKDSGVEWLGEVPEHWTIPQIGYHSKVTKLTGFEYTNLWRPNMEGKIIALRGFNIQERYLDLSKTERITEELSNKLARSKLYEGDIVLPCTGTLGNAALIQENDLYHINQNIAKVTINSELFNTEFTVFWMTSLPFRQMIDFNNTSGMQPVLLIGDIRKLPIPLLPLDEQQEIVDFLLLKTEQFDRLIDNAEQAIKLMQERRTALISAAVTGKIDVRGWQA